MSGVSFLCTDMGRALESLHCFGSNDPNDVDVCACTLGTCCCLGLSMGASATTATFYTIPLKPALLFAPAIGECLGGSLALSVNVLLCRRGPTEAEKRVAHVFCAAMMCGIATASFGFFGGASSWVDIFQTGCVSTSLHGGFLVGMHLSSRALKHCFPHLCSRNENALEVPLTPGAVAIEL